jgi:hypothetical protein
MTRSKWSLALALALVFASGIVAGALGYRYYDRYYDRKADAPPKSPEEFRRAYVSAMRSRLRLSESQVKQLEVILDDTRDKFRDFREKQRPEMKAIQDEQTARISAMLDVAQRQEYEKMRRERDERRKAAPPKDRGRRP